MLKLLLIFLLVSSCGFNLKRGKKWHYERDLYRLPEVCNIDQESTILNKLYPMGTPVSEVIKDAEADGFKCGEKERERDAICNIS